MRVDEQRRLMEFMLAAGAMNRRLAVDFKKRTPGNDWLVLAHLASSDDEVYVSDLAEITGLTGAGVSKLLDRMSDREMITRVWGTNPDDRRHVAVRLTKTGRRDLRGVLAILQTTVATHGEMFDRLARAIVNVKGHH